MDALDPEVEDRVHWSEDITPYDKAHFITYARLLDAEMARADWREVALIVLHRDCSVDMEGAQRCWEDHLNRAHWMTTSGYKHLLVNEER